MRLSIAGSVLSLTLFAFPAIAHDHGPGAWINQQALKDPFSGESCCSGIDCEPTKVREVAGGYIVETGEFIIRERVLWRSQDGSWWRCRVMGGPNINKTRCLIAPPSGS